MIFEKKNNIKDVLEVWVYRWDWIINNHGDYFHK